MSRILLIDDELSSRLVMHNRLKDLGHEVTVAENGAKGLLEIREAPFDLALVEYNLASGVSGPEVCRRLKQMPQAMTMPVVLISRHSGSRDDVHRGFEAGCDAFVTKSDLSVLDDVLRSMLHFKALYDEQVSHLRALEEINRRLKESAARAPEGESGASSPESQREGAVTRPEGILLVDADGIVRYADRGARDLFGGGLEGKNLGRLAPASGLEAFVRDARSEAREGFRVDLPARAGRSGRSLSAAVVPLISAPGSKDPELRIVLIFDHTRRRMTAELLRVEEYVLPRGELGVLLEAARTAFGPSTVVGTSAAAAQLRGLIAEASDGAQPVLILGERGTGKEHFARAVHFSGESGGPFLPVGCAGLSQASLESELFGHVPGGLEGLPGERPGLFQQGAHGTILLKDVEHMGLPLQAKLERALREGKVNRAGSTKDEICEVHVLAASSADLSALVREGTFLPGLLEALSGFVVVLPPLRERREDVPLLAQKFLVRHAAGRPELEVSDSALWALENYDWPGNVRELENCMRRAIGEASERDSIEVNDLPPAVVELAARLPQRDLTPSPPPQRVALGNEYAGVRRSNVGFFPASAKLPGNEEFSSGSRSPWEISPDEPPSLELYEMKALLHALDKTAGDKLAAARLLKVGKSTLYRKLKRYGIA
jgi:DNA-binding NtrC family response regulator